MPATSQPSDTPSGTAPTTRAQRHKGNRIPRLRMRTQLLLPVTAALTGLLILALIQFLGAWADYNESSDAEKVSDMAHTLVDLVDSGQSEVGWALEAGHITLDDMDRLRKETDELSAEFRSQADPLVELYPELDDSVSTVSANLDQLSWARDILDDVFAGNTSTDETVAQEAYAVYRDSGNSLVELGFELTTLIDDSEVTAQLDALAAALQAGRYGAELQFRIMTDIEVSDDSGLVNRNRLAEAALLAGSYDEQINQFHTKASPSTREAYDEFREREGPTTAREALAVYLQGSVPQISSQDWMIAQAETVSGLHEVQTQNAEELSELVDDKKVSATTSLLTTVGVLTLLSFFAVATAISLARRISDRIDTVRENTLSAAYDELPKTVASVAGATSPKQVDELLERAKNRHSEIAGDSGRDELSSLAAAFSTAHYQALRQSANQALLRLDVQAMMRTLARRGHTLIRRQQDMLEESVDKHDDSEIPQQWKSLYHLASRMRRNEENLLFLAGGDPARRYGNPTDFGTVIGDGAAEIESAHRIHIDNSVTASLTPEAASDVVRILSEILDNAASFSPPKTPVQVVTRRSGSDLVLSVADQGIGLQPSDVEAINQRLSEPTQLTSELTATMGLLVVGRLAAQHDIQVRLHSTFGKGTLAVVTLPAHTLIDTTDHTGAMQQHPPARLALAAHAANVPMAGTGRDPEVPTAIDPIVPDQRSRGGQPASRPAAAQLPPASGPGGRINGVEQPQVATTSETPSKINVTFKSVNMTLQQEAQQPQGPDNLPRRDPGSRLVPGSIPDNAVPPRSNGGGANDSSAAPLDPNEIRSRLSGFASGIAAADDELGHDTQ
ncbi:sensor histidine kinase [Haloglycomyces albus]|uniref:sensor histidine kinase n=1 Tax=Haloglycomyces albus TaxID=526067 RepID=UPI0004B14071|nr:ATP-binding protein [Haloglycomyces albus]